jgi:hypothetical protein
VFLAESRVITTSLRALHGAPVWTEEEVEGLNRVFSTFGWEIVKHGNTKGLRPNRYGKLWRTRY